MTHPDDLRAWRHAHVPVFNDNKLKLGIFGMNCSNGNAAVTISLECNFA